MIPKLRKIRRALFPLYTAPKYTWVGSVLRIQCYKGDTAQFPSRFAVVVGKRSYKNTPQRNHFKRVVLSKIRENTQYFDKLPFVNYIILPKKPLSQITLTEIITDITHFYEEQKSSKVHHS